MKISDKQKSAMFEFLKKNPNMICGTFSITYSQNDGRRKWEELTEKLNRIGAAKKSWKSWRKTWQDMRSRAKLKAWRSDISKSDEDILNICKVVASIPTISAIRAIASFEINVEDEVFPIKTEEIQDDIQIEKNQEIILIENSISIKSETSDDDVLMEEPTVVEEEIPLPKETSIQSPVKYRTISTSTKKYTSSLERKLQLKATYYRKKLALLKDSISAKRQCANALSRIADALERNGR